MKKYFLTLLFAVFALVAFADQSSILYLKNGSVIKGEILEAVPGGNIKIQTIDGSIFVYSADEVERIAKNEEAKPTRSSITSTYEYVAPKGLDMYIGVGPDFSVGSGGGVTLDAQIEIGKRFNKSLFLGIGGGVMTGGGSSVFPLMGGGRIFMPIDNPKILPYLSVRGGYAFGKSGVACVEVMPGFQYKMSKNVDFSFGVGYMGSFGNGSASAIGVRVGFGLHGSTDEADINKPKKPSTPTRSKGLQFELEGSGAGPINHSDILSTSFGPGFSFNYKMNSRLSAGIGARYQFNRDIPYHYHIDINDSELPIRANFSDHVYCSEESGCIDFFVKGKYRLLGEKRFSPILGVEIGASYFMAFYGKSSPGTSGEIYNKETHDYERYEIDGELKNNISLYIMPSFGYSLRIGTNSYIDLKVGYKMYSAVNRYVVDEKTDNIIYEKYKAPSFNCIQASISYSHTFNLMTGK